MPRTSAPMWARSATTATSRPPAPPSRLDASQMTAIDEAVNAAFEPLRGNQQVDRAAALLSNLADYGLIWVALAAFKARRRGPNRRRAVVALAAAGFSSMIVNRVVKEAVARERPDDHLE